MPTVPMPPSTRIHSWSLVKRSMAMNLPLFSALAGVAVGHERQRRDRRAQCLAAHHQIDGRADLGVIRLHVAHRHGAIDAGAEAARGDDADALAAGRKNLGALASRRASVRPDADALLLGATGQFLLNALGAGEAAPAAPPLLDRPGEARLDGAGGLVDVVAVEAEARLEAQRVARAEADGLHAV